MAQTLRDRLINTPPAVISDIPSWMPEEGDIVSGKITAIKTKETQYGTATSLIVDDEERGPTDVFCLRYALKAWVEKDRPAVGDSVAIRYDGEGTAPTGNTIHRYTCMLEHAAQPPTPAKIEAAAKKTNDPFEDE